MSRSIIIESYPEDAHAWVVQAALSSLGIDNKLLFWGNFPARLSTTYDSGSDELRISGQSDILFGTQPATLWHRRWAKPGMPRNAHNADTRLIEKSCEVIIRSFAQEAHGPVFNVNTDTSRQAVASKIFQLRLARNIGFTIPETLVSNSYKDVREFVARGPCIVKPLTRMTWTGTDYAVQALTSRVSLSDLRNVSSIALCPMIYQREVQKQVEYRATVIGREVVLAQLHSQVGPEASLDWRRVPASSLCIRWVKCPDDLRSRILAFMDAAGLAMGSLDFAVTLDDKVVFFEVNEQGQFLWLEQADASIPLLDMFVDFLCRGSRDFIYDRSSPLIRFATFFNEEHAPTKAEVLDVHEPYEPDWAEKEFT